MGHSLNHLRPELKGTSQKDIAQKGLCLLGVIFTFTESLPDPDPDPFVPETEDDPLPLLFFELIFPSFGDG